MKNQDVRNKNINIIHKQKKNSKKKVVSHDSIV